MTTPDTAILHSDAFRRESLSSERARVRWTIVALLIVGLAAVVREVLFTPDSLGRNLGLTVGLTVVAVGYEVAVLRLLVRAGDRELPPLHWRLNTICEALFPTLVLVAVLWMGTVDPYRTLSLPLMALYYLAVLLTTMRLQPRLCVLSGAVGAIGYWAVVAWTFVMHAPAPEGTVHPAVYATGGLMMLVAGLIAAAIAAKIRGYLIAAIEEAEQRQTERVRSRDTLIFGLAKLAEHRDTDTGAHLERISEYVVVLAEEMRGEHEMIDDAWIETLRVASSLHDIGKVGIPDAVLCKPGKLDDDERAVIQTHTRLGAETLRAIRERQGEDALLEMSERIAAEHHERWDGEGYPAGIGGDSIALAARIISVADVYDALTSKRVYKPAMSHEQALEIMLSGRGTQFDPGVVAALERAGARFDAIRRRHA